MSRLNRIVVADLQVGVNTVRTVLGPGPEIVGTDNLREAIDKVESGADLVICGIHFDDCRMFDLLRLVKANPETREIPFVCFRDMDSAIGPSVLEGLQIACKALGAVDFIDLFQLKSKYGVPEADRVFRKILLECTA